MSVEVGEDVPIPTLPLARIVKSEVVAEPLLLVDEAMSKRRCCEANAPCRESLAYAVVVPIASALLVES